MQKQRFMRLDEIKADSDIHARSEFRRDTIEDWSERMKAGERFPAAVGFFDGTAVWLAGGFHRYMAAKQAGKSDILIEVREGTNLDAKMFAASANCDNGIARTRGDKRKAVMILPSEPKWAERSSRWVAKAACVGHSFVDDIRRELDAFRALGIDADSLPATRGRPPIVPGSAETTRLAIDGSGYKHRHKATKSKPKSHVERRLAAVASCALDLCRLYEFRPATGDKATKVAWVNLLVSLKKAGFDLSNSEPQRKAG